MRYFWWWQGDFSFNLWSTKSSRLFMHQQRRQTQSKKKCDSFVQSTGVFKTYTPFSKHIHFFQNIYTFAQICFFSNNTRNVPGDIGKGFIGERHDDRAIDRPARYMKRLGTRRWERMRWDCEWFHTRIERNMTSALPFRVFQEKLLSSGFYKGALELKKRNVIMPYTLITIHTNPA